MKRRIALTLFVALQLGDLITTLQVFRHGGYEANPFAALLFSLVGATAGIAACKVGCCLLAMRVRLVPLIYVASAYYAGVVGWNLFLLTRSSA